MTQDELKQAVAQAAADYVANNTPDGAIIGVGTGSTANFFIGPTYQYIQRWSNQFNGDYNQNIVMLRLGARL